MKQSSYDYHIFIFVMYYKCSLHAKQIFTNHKIHRRKLVIYNTVGRGEIENCSGAKQRIANVARVTRFALYKWDGNFPKYKFKMATENGVVRVCVTIFLKYFALFMTLCDKMSGRFFCKINTANFA
jgi:hypothetical protein